MDYPVFLNLVLNISVTNVLGLQLIEVISQSH
jgi:hypothetical protein